MFYCLHSEHLALLYFYLALVAPCKAKPYVRTLSKIGFLFVQKWFSHLNLIFPTVFSEALRANPVIKSGREKKEQVNPWPKVASLILYSATCHRPRTMGLGSSPLDKATLTIPASPVWHPSSKVPFLAIRIQDRPNKENFLSVELCWNELATLYQTKAMTVQFDICRAGENAKSARSAFYAIFWLIVHILRFCDKKYRILKFRDKSTVF